MAKILVDRDVLVQALNALEEVDGAIVGLLGSLLGSPDEDAPGTRVRASITALRAVVAPAERTEVADLRCATWLDPECADKGTCQSLKFKLVAETVQKPVAWASWWLHHGQHNYRAKPLTSERVKELMKLAFEVGREAASPPAPSSVG